MLVFSQKTCSVFEVVWFHFETMLEFSSLICSFILWSDTAIAYLFLSSVEYTSVGAIG